MKIKINNNNLENLKKLHKDIEKFLEISSQEIELNEENFKKVKELSNTIYEITKNSLNIGTIRLKLEISNGIEFTII